MAPNRRGARLVAGAVGLSACGLIAWFETHKTIPAFRAWSFGAIFLLTAACVVLAPARLRNAALSLSTCVLALFVLELTAVAIEPRGLTFTSSPAWLKLRPVVGFGFDRAMVVHARETSPAGHVIFDVDYTIGNTFDRVVRTASSGPATVFFGDSYTFGWGLNDADTLPQLYADLEPHDRVLNLAIDGYSPQQFLREVETGWRDDIIGPKPKALVMMTGSFHASRVACKDSWTNNAPRYALVDGEPAYQGVCYSGAALAWREFLTSSALYRVALRPYLSRVTHADVDLYIAVLTKAVRLARERYGVDTLVPFVDPPGGFMRDSGWTSAAIFDALKAKGVRVVDMSLPSGPDYAIPGDGHPTAKANAMRAKMIADLLKSPVPSTHAADAGLEP